MDIRVCWSPDLRALADDLLDKWEDTRRNASDPFAKIGIVVHDISTEKWLKQYFLLERKIPQITMDLVFIRLPEFVNDWLDATLHGESPRERHANQHPYSQNVLAWRIYRILEAAKPEGGLKGLLDYIKGNAEKRYSLAVQLASLYDDYLNSRFRMLCEWENNDSSRLTDFDVSGSEWQIALYRKLAEEDHRTYARDYEIALRRETDAAQAFESGFPRYLAIYVFDCPFIPEPSLRLLEKISEAVTMTFYNFNPKDDWLAETPSQKEVAQQIRNMIRKHRKALDDARKPEELATGISETFYDSPDERLLGALCSGARGILGALCDDCEGDVEVRGGRKPLEGLKNVQISIHNTYSPRRELEAVKDGLHDFLQDGRNAPHEALVLCADWEIYAPIIDAVFPPASEAAGCIPVAMAGMPGGTPLMESFGKLLEFRKNRFEVSAVFGLLDVPAIRENYGLDEDAVDALRDMVRKANIHWGRDDDDVARILEAENQKKGYPFTWQRGFERLTAELLYGFPQNDELLLTVGDISGRLHPCGHVEGDRAKSVAALWTMVEHLTKLRGELSQGQKATPENLQGMFLEIINDFYAESSDSSLELGKMRHAIRSVAENLWTAGLDDSEIDVEVFIQAVQDAMKNQMPERKSLADAVQFAPLNAYTATPRKFIWICGLNDGVFPRMERRASFDLIGRHPSLFDATSREKDAFALLKATLCAEERLSFSYVGKEMRSNEDIPSSVLLTNLTDYFKVCGIRSTTYTHPLQGYSQRYFFEFVPGTEEEKNKLEKLKLPPSYSTTYREMMEILHDRRAASSDVSRRTSDIVPFPLQESGVTEIALDDLVELFVHPNRFLLERRLNARIPWSYEFDDSESLEAKLGNALKRRLALENTPEDMPPAALLVETGNAPDEDSAEGAIEDAQKSYKRPIKFTKKNANNKMENVYACLGDDGEPLVFAETYKAFQMLGEDTPMEIMIPERGVRLFGSCKLMALKTKDGISAPHVLLFMDDMYDSTEVEIKIRHLAVNAVLEDGAATIAFSPDGKRCCKPLCKDAAREKLCSLVKLATEPMPEGYPDFGKIALKDDQLPEEWRTILKLDEIEII